MAFQLTLPTLLGVIIGGVAFVFCLAVAIVILSLRVKHRRQLARTNLAGERRLSGYPGGNLEITDGDVAQMPGTGAAMRESLCNRYTRASAYAPMASRESVEKQLSKSTIPSMPICTPRNIQNGAIVTKSSPALASPSRPWPLPPRLKRSNRPPAIELRLPPAASAVNTTTDGLETLAVKLNGNEVPKLVPRDEGLKIRGSQTCCDSQTIATASSEKPATPSPTLRPKPLFHEKHRSKSHGMIQEISRRKSPGSIRLSRDLPPRSPGSTFPRSISLTSQGPGTIPIAPVPPLPVEALAIRRQRSEKTSGSRQSLVVAISRQNIGDSLWKEASPTSVISNTLVNTSTRSGDCLQKDQSLDNEKNLRPPLVNATVAGSEKVKASLGSCMFVQPSMQDGISRSSSSGLSESLLSHGWSGSISATSTVKEGAHARSKAPADHNAGAHISVFDFGLPLRSDVDIEALSQLDSDDPHAKRRSASILQMISGNEQSSNLSQKEERPISIATEIPIRWSTDVLARDKTSDTGEIPDGLARSRRRSKNSSARQQSVGRSTRTSSNAQKLKPSWTTPNPQAQSLRHPRIDPPAFRPPSMSTFDPQLTRIPQSEAHSARTATSPNLKHTLEILTGQNDSDSSTSSPTSTPTRRPTQKRQPSGTHPNRQRAIFDGASKIAQWPVAGHHPAFSLGLRATNDEKPEKANIFRVDAQIKSNQETNANFAIDEDEHNAHAPSYRPPSLLYRFPSPPSPPLRTAGESGGSFNIPENFQSRSQSNIIQPTQDSFISSYPRGPQSKTISNLNILASNNHSNDGEIANSPRDQLRQSVLALRRMNSEVSEPSKAGREHRRYLSLGEKEEPIFEDRDDGVDGGNVDRGALRRIGSTSTVTTILDAPAPPSLSQDRRAEAERKLNSGRGVVRGPRAMPSWLDESMMISSPSSYEPNVVSGAF